MSSEKCSISMSASDGPRSMNPVYLMVLNPRACAGSMSVDGLSPTITASSGSMPRERRSSARTVVDIALLFGAPDVALVDDRVRHDIHLALGRDHGGEESGEPTSLQEAAHDVAADRPHGLLHLGHDLQLHPLVLDPLERVFQAVAHVQVLLLLLAEQLLGFLAVIQHVAVDEVPVPFLDLAVLAVHLPQPAIPMDALCGHLRLAQQLADIAQDQRVAQPPGSMMHWP